MVGGERSMLHTGSTPKSKMHFSALFLQRLARCVEIILAQGGDGCVLVVVRGGKIRRLQLRLDDDLPPAADMVWGAATTE